MTLHRTEDPEVKAAFYLERLLEQLDRECPLVAHHTFVTHHTTFRDVLDAALLDALQERVFAAAPGADDVFQPDWKELEHALEFGEYRFVHDTCNEYLLRYSHLRGQPSAESCLRQAQELLARCRMFFIEPEEMRINTFINGRIQFVVSERRSSSNHDDFSGNNGNGNGNGEKKKLQGDPGFSLVDALGSRYRCFVKQLSDARIDEVVRLKITNITEQTIRGEHGPERVVYMEPRVHSQEQVVIVLDDLSYTGNSYTFRLHSYDGFLWFKRRGVNHREFNPDTLHPGDHIVAQVLYTTEEVKLQRDGRIQRLGIIKAIPVRRVRSMTVAGPGTSAASIPA